MVGVIVGLWLWMVLVEILPWGAGTWLASVPLTPLADGDRWQAGAQLMHDADRASFAKMMELYKACPPEVSAERCAPAIAEDFIAKAGVGSGAGVLPRPPAPPAQP